MDKAEQAPAIFKEELQGLLKLVAQNISVILRPESAVKMVAQWTDHPATVKSDGITFALGDAYDEEEKNLLVSLLVPGLKTLGPATVAQLVVAYAEIGETEVRGKVIKHEVRVNVTDADAANSATPEVEVLQQYGLQYAAKARKQAIAEADGGDYEQAERTLREAMEKLTSLPDPGSLLKDEIKDLEEHTRQLDESSYTHTRKVMRETAYRRVNSWAALNDKAILYAYPAFPGTRDHRLVQIMKKRIDSFSLLLGGVQDFDVAVVDGSDECWRNDVISAAKARLRKAGRQLCAKERWGCE